MDPTIPDELADPYSLVVECLKDPSDGSERLPHIVGLFESDERRLRLSAAWACCVVVNTVDDEETIEYLIRRLSDRLDEKYVSLELTTTLDYISTRYSEQVERVLEAIEEEETERDHLPLPQVGDFTRSHYYNSEVSGPDDVGRTHVPGETVDDDSQTTEEGIEQRNRDPEREDGESAASADDEETDGRGGPMAQQRTAVTSVATQSQFDKLHILAARNRSRYADVYEALVARRGDEQAVALRLLDQPDGNQIEYRRRVKEQLRRWAAVSDHPHVVGILDWGVEKRPWLATDLAGDSLAEVGQVSPEQAVTDALDLTGAISHLHKNGVVHGGLDPRNVIYPDDIVAADDSEPPFLDNVGLLNAFRYHFRPSLYLDPRFAAPEYFDDRYGQIDHSTDIYQLGAVIYQLCTGQPPFDGQFQEVREAILNADPPRPTAAADIPPVLDDIVSKAMARQKLRRYETIEHLEQELASSHTGDSDG